MSDIVLKIKTITHRFGLFTAVDSPHLSVNAGEIFDLLGSMWVFTAHTKLEKGVWQ